MAARDGTSSLGDLVSHVVDEDLSARLTRGQRAAHIWYEANGDVERRHTCGVYLRDSRVRGADPVLGVYVDTGARLTDFRTNKELYLMRLANAGLRVSDVDFRLSRRPRPLYAAERRAPENTRPADPLPALTPQEERRVSELCEGLPDGLRQSASRAISLSLRRKKSAATQSDESQPQRAS